MSVESPKITWDYGIPTKQAKEHGVEYCFFDIIFKDKRRQCLRLFLDKGEVKDLIKAFNLIKKYYKKHGEPKWEGLPVPMILKVNKEK